MEKTIQKIKILTVWVCLLTLIVTSSGCQKLDETQPENKNVSEEQGQNKTNGKEEDSLDKEAEPSSQEETEKGSEALMEKQETNKYAGYADWAQEKLYENFWNTKERSFYNSYPNSKEEEHLNYWWKAHAADAMIDGYERTGKEEYAKRAESIIKNTISRNGSLYNEFYDDMQWMALACLRLYDLTGNEKMGEYAKKLWKDIQTAWWEDEIGGLAWKKDEARKNRNACSNGPAAILAARLYQRFGEEEDLAWAKRIYEFETANLVDPETGMVFDGLVVEENGEKNVNRDWLFTYNAGTYIGAGVELYQITKESRYLEQAKKTAASSMEAFTTVYGVTKSEGQGDGGMFKGIYIRYLEQLYETGEMPEIKDYLLKNADMLMKNGCTPDIGIFGPEWNKVPQQPVDVTCQLSGVFLFEAAARAEVFINN